MNYKMCGIGNAHQTHVAVPVDKRRKENKKKK